MIKLTNLKVDFCIFTWLCHWERNHNCGESCSYRSLHFAFIVLSQEFLEWQPCHSYAENLFYQNYHTIEMYAWPFVVQEIFYSNLRGGKEIREKGNWGKSESTAASTIFPSVASMPLPYRERLY